MACACLSEAYRVVCGFSGVKQGVMFSGVMQGVKQGVMSKTEWQWGAFAFGQEVNGHAFVPTTHWAIWAFLFCPQPFPPLLPQLLQLLGCYYGE